MYSVRLRTAEGEWQDFVPFDTCYGGSATDYFDVVNGVPHLLFEEFEDGPLDEVDALMLKCTLDPLWVPAPVLGAEEWHKIGEWKDGPRTWYYWSKLVEIN